MRERDADAWEELARREPYFAVLDSDGHRDVAGGESATEAFFQSGEDDIAALLPAIAALLGRDVPLGAALDYGCGAGRLTLALARRAGRVVGCDIAPTMLRHARANAVKAGLVNATFIGTEELVRLRAAQFDFICSLLVFEHIPPKHGYEIIRTLLRLLAPGGVAALHVTYAKPGARLRRLARALPHRANAEAATAGAGTQAPGQAYEYEDRVIQRDALAAGARIAGKLPTGKGHGQGAVLVVEKALSI